MRAQLAAALRAQPQDEGNADTNALRALHKKRTINVLATTVKTSVDVRVVLEDPKLPSKQDLGRWWPEPARETLSPLVPFPTRPAMDTFDTGFKVVSHASPPSTSMRGSLGGSLTPGFASPPLGSPSAAMARSASALVLPRSASLPAVARDGKSAPATASPLSTHGSPLGSINARGQSRIGGKWRSKPRLGDPSANLGNPAIIELPDGGTDTPLDVFEHLGKGGTPYALAFSQQLETLDRSSRLAQWMNAFAADEEAFASKAVFVEMRLRQALSSSVSLGVLERASNLTWTSASHASAHHGALPSPQVLERASNLIWTSASCMLTTAPSPCMHMLTTAPSVEPSNGPPPCVHVLTTAPCLACTCSPRHHRTSSRSRIRFGSPSCATPSNASRH